MLSFVLNTLTSMLTAAGSSACFVSEQDSAKMNSFRSETKAGNKTIIIRILFFMYEGDDNTAWVGKA